LCRLLVKRRILNDNSIGLTTLFSDT